MMSFVIFLLLISFGCGTNGMVRSNPALSCLKDCRNVSCFKEKCNEYVNNLHTLHSNGAIKANYNATLQCRDTNLLSIKHNIGLFIIQQESSIPISNSSSLPINFINGSRSIFPNLRPGVKYRFHIRRLGNGSISQLETTDWFTTLKGDYKPKAIRNISILNFQKSIQGSHLTANFVFQPSEDLNCYYRLLHWNEDEGLSNGFLKATRDFSFSIENLSYSQNNTVILSVENQNRSLGSIRNISLNFSTPSCLDVYQNLSICAPAKVTGLSITHVDLTSSGFNFTIKWDRPNLLPDYYSIRIANLLDQSRDFHLFNVSGNVTETFCHVESTGFQFEISIVAESRGGVSTWTSISHQFKLYDRKHFTVSNILLIVISSAIIIAILLSIFYGYCAYRRVKIKKKGQKFCSNLTNNSKLIPLYEKLSKTISDSEEKAESESLMLKDDFEVNLKNLQVKGLLGSGISGIVRFGILKVDKSKSIDVAVKTLKDYPTAEELQNFQREILIMKSAGVHQNIVSMIGCCTLNANPMLIVEYCSKGDLQTYLRTAWENIMTNALTSKTSCKFSFRIGNKESVSNQLYDFQGDLFKTEEISVLDLLNFARQIANGMEYLSSNRIVHRDLAARNVLVCSDQTIKISDFGLSRDVYCENVYKKTGDGKLPLKWMAIESLTHQIYTTQSDVWSFGILLWEIVTLGSNPYPGIPTNTILALLKSGYRMKRPLNCGVELYDLMVSCWRTSPKCRPTFTELKNSLEKLLQTASQHEYLNLYNASQEFTNT